MDSGENAPCSPCVLMGMEKLITFSDQVTSSELFGFPTLVSVKIENENRQIDRFIVKVKYL